MTNDTRHYWLAPMSGTFEIALSLEEARGASHAGHCDDDVRELSEEPHIAAQLATIDPAAIVSELREYGAWHVEELADHEQNLQRILWLAAGDIAEEARA